MKICKIESCNTKIHAREMCSAHYRTFLRHGDPLKSLLNFGCKVELCDGQHKSQGYCNLHYRRFLRQGDPLKVIKGRLPVNFGCKVDQCEDKHRTKGYCKFHYQRFRKHGDPHTVLTPIGPKAKYPTMRKRFDNSYEMVTQTGCWIWTGYLNTAGYGGITWKNKAYAAHRYSYEQFISSIPAGLCVLHKCDTPQCVNPNHLFLGSSIDNVADKMSKGRQAKGQIQGSSKLTVDKVAEIRKSKETYKQIANKYEVGVSTINKIRARITWRHV